MKPSHPTRDPLLMSELTQEKVSALSREHANGRYFSEGM